MAKEEKNNAEEIKNIVTISEAGPCKKKVEIEIPEEKIEKAFDTQYYELRKDAEVPGFRKGRAPRRLLEKRFGKDVIAQTKLRLLVDASDSAIKDNELDVLGDPNIDHESIEMPEKGALKFDFEVEVRPAIDLPSLEGIKVEKPKLEVTDASIDEEIVAMAKRMGTFEPKDGKAKLEDQIIADVTIKSDEETESEKNVEIAVGEKGFVWKVPIEELGKVIVGAAAGDIKTTSVDIPETFFDEKYRGKKVEVEIKVSDIKEMIPAEMNADFFTKLGLEDEAALKDALRERSEQNLEKQARDAMAKSVYAYLKDSIDIELPADVVADQAQQGLQREYMRLLQGGTAAAEVSAKLDEIKAASETQARAQLKSFFIMDAVATKLDIQTTEEEVNGYIAQMAMYQQTRPEKMREKMAKDGSLSQVALEIREQKCIDKILESAKITEVAAEKAAKKSTAKKTSSKKKTTKKAVKKTDSEDKPAKKTASKKKTTKKTPTKKKSD